MDKSVLDDAHVALGGVWGSGKSLQSWGLNFVCLGGGGGIPSQIFTSRVRSPFTEERWSHALRRHPLAPI